MVILFRFWLGFEYRMMRQHTGMKIIVQMEASWEAVLFGSDDELCSRLNKNDLIRIKQTTLTCHILVSKTIHFRMIWYKIILVLLNNGFRIITNKIRVFHTITFISTLDIRHVILFRMLPQPNEPIQTRSSNCNRKV